MKALVFILLAILSLPTAAQAADFSAGPVTLPIPAGFDGPFEQSQGNARAIGFAKPGATAGVNTLLQVNILDLGDALAGLPDAERGAAAERYLAELIVGVERRRSGFKRTAPESLLLDGIPAAKAHWTGRMEDLDAVGTMYCVVVGTHVISFHTQDAGTRPSAGMLEAIRAFEAVRWNAD